VNVLSGTNVIVAGAGLSGLTAARSLERAGADVAVVDARPRVGGRVWTLREGFARGQHAEAGGDLIEADHAAVRQLADELGLSTTRILRKGFAYYGVNGDGLPSVQPLETTLSAIYGPLAGLVHDYQIGERRWDGAIARRLGRVSVAEWLTARGEDRHLLQRFRGLRGLFLADPEDLSLLALVDFLADERHGPGSMMRIEGGNDRLATAMAESLRHPPELETVLRRVRQEKSAVTVTLETRGVRAERRVDFLVAAIPASTLRDVPFEPHLPVAQQEAIAKLRYGRATRVLAQFARRFWHKPSRPRAYGSDQPIGAVWDGNEEQPGRPGILSLLAGGAASPALQEILGCEGIPGVVRRLEWLGEPSPLLTSRTVVWEADRWSCGGYAYFDRSFDPSWRDELALPSGRVVFAGEHTSLRWQGYMKGAVESGLRAAAEILHLQKA
jgi:monoamine oxidase